MENTTALLQFKPRWLDYFGIHPSIFIFCALFLLIGIPGNVLVLYVYSKCFKSTFGLFVKTLAILDLANIISFAPAFAISRLIPELDSPSLCKFMTQEQNFNSTVTGLLYVTIAFQRYRLICQPRRFQIRVSCAEKLVIGSIAFSLLCGLPIAFVITNNFLRVHLNIGNETFIVYVPTCDFTSESKAAHSALAITSWFFILLVFVLTSLVVLYSLIGRHIKKHNLNTPRTNGSRIPISTMTKVFCVLTFVYMITTIPRVGVAVYFKEMKSLPSMELYHVQIFDVFIQMPYLNCIVNPFVYGFCSSTFRRQVRSIYCKSESQQSNEPSGTTTSL